MHPIMALLVGVSSTRSPSSTALMMSTSVTPTTSTNNPTTTPFWHDETRIQGLSDPPSPDLLRKIQEQPWRGALEPVPPMGIPLHEATIMDTTHSTIPSDLKGRLYRNGPGRIRIGDSQYGHWFDGDGLVTQLCLWGSDSDSDSNATKPPTATFMAKYVKTKRFQSQQQLLSPSSSTGKVPMATAGPWTRKGQGGFLENLFAIPTNPSNTNVLFLTNNNEEEDETPENPQEPRLFALAEGGDPVQLDLDTLETLDTQPFQSAKGDEKVQSPFAAHYKKDPLTGDIFNHGIVLGPTTSVNVMKLKGNGDLLLQSTHELPVLCFIHDSMISEHHFLLLVQPYSAPPSSLLTSVMGGKPLGQQLEWNPKEMDDQSLVLVFSKETLECVGRISIPLVSSYHQIDAFEDPFNPHWISFRLLVHDPPHSRNQVEEGFKDMYSHAKIPICQLWQYTIDVHRGTFRDRRRVAPQAGLCELPTTNAAWREYKKRYVWTNTRTDEAGYVNSLQKVDLETGECSDMISFGETSFAGNPIFVPKATPEKEDDGYILSQVYRSDEHRSDVVILDAATMKQLTLLRLNCHVPYQFHGEWYSDLS